MSEEERFKLENELLMTKSKAQMINLYIDKLDQLQQKENIIKEVREYIKQTGQYLEDIKRFKVNVLEPNYLDILDILDKVDKDNK